MLVYRLNRSNYANDLSGTGAAIYGGRWNPKGIPLLYTAGSISLAYLEYLAHNIHVFSANSITLSIIKIKDPLIQEIDSKNLSDDWRTKEYSPLSTQQAGKQFFDSGKFHILKVPSAIVPHEFNFLLNPLHPNHKLITIEEQICPFILDERFFQK